jgi:dTDP-4-amino-4,6-dideoxygalactose transaminase
MHLQPIYRENPFVTSAQGGCSDVGADIFNRGLCLPSDVKMTAQEQDMIIEIVKRCFD